MGGAFAVAGAEAFGGGQALLPEDVGDSAFKAFFGKRPDHFGEPAFLQQIIDVPAQFFASAHVAPYPGGETAQGGADVGVIPRGKVDCAQASDLDYVWGFEADEEDVGAGGGGELETWLVHFLESV